MLRVKSACLPFPAVLYSVNSYQKGKEAVEPQRRSEWNIPDDEGFVTVNTNFLKYFLIVDSTRTNMDEAVVGFHSELRNQMYRRLRMDVSKVACVNPKEAPARFNGNNLEELMRQALEKKANLVVLMLSFPNRYVYAQFKTLADQTLGIQSLCLAKLKLVSEKSSAGKYMTNIAQKINIKFKGVNSRVEEIRKCLGNDTLVLEADVVHPGHGALPEAPSIACIVGSVDQYGGRFLGSARLQSKDKKDREASGLLL
jgi:hypothetical protein